MATSLIYQSSLLYELAMVGLYGRHYAARCRALADLVPAGASVLDLCCGPATLYHRYLRHKAVRYTGLDLNANFIRQLIRSGARAHVWDLRSDATLPPSEFVIMLASLYHFLPNPGPIVNRMLQAARKQVIVAEPIRNLANSNLPLLKWLAWQNTNPGSGAVASRFTEESLNQFFAHYGGQIRQTFLIPGGRERVYVLAPAAESSY